MGSKSSNDVKKDDYGKQNNYYQVNHRIKSE